MRSERQSIDTPDPDAPTGPSLARADELPTTGELAIFGRWEKLRSVYNLVLLAETVVLMMVWEIRPARPLGCIRSLVVAAIAANICFCAGPVIQYHVHRLRLRHHAVLAMIFVPGQVLAVLLAYLALSAMRVSLQGGGPD